jgi:hypothetical protein
MNLMTNAFLNGSLAYIYKTSSVATLYQQSSGGQHQWFTAPSGTAGNAITFTQAMTLDASGNLLVGTTSTSSLAASGRGLIEVNGTSDSAFAMKANGTLYGYLFNSSAEFRVANATANPVTFFTNNTERARITSGGALLINDTANALSTNLHVLATNNAFDATNTTSASFTTVIWNQGTTGDNKFVEYATEGSYTQRGSIDYNRAGGLTRYNTTSDYRAKDIIGPIANPGATIDALKVYEGLMKGATQSRPMLVAHEAQEHAPYAVSGFKDEVNEDGTPRFQQIDVSSLVPLLIAELQSLRARVAQLEKGV